MNKTFDQMSEADKRAAGKYGFTARLRGGGDVTVVGFPKAKGRRVRVRRADDTTRTIKLAAVRWIEFPQWYIDEIRSRNHDRNQRRARHHA